MPRMPKGLGPRIAKGRRRYITRIIDVSLVLGTGEKQEPFRFTTRWLQDFIQNWLKENPEPKFDNPDWFLKEVNEDRETVRVDSKKESRTLAERREWKFIQRELDLVETLYALGMHLTQEGGAVHVSVGTPFDHVSSGPMIPSRTPVDPRTKRYTLRKSLKRQKLPALLTKHRGNLELSAFTRLKAFTWSKDSRFLATASNEAISREPRPRNDRISIWDVETLKRIATLEGDRKIIGLIWGTKTELVSISQCGTILWKHDKNHWTPSVTELVDSRMIFGSTQPRALFSLSYDGSWLAKPRGNHTIDILDARNSTRMGSIELPTYSKMVTDVRDIQWSPIGDKIAVLIRVMKEEDNDDRIIILNPQKGTRVRTIKTGNSRPNSLFEALSSLCWNPNGTIIAGSTDDSVIFWDAKRGNMIGEMSGGFNTLLWSPDGKLLAGHVGNTIRFWDVSSISISEKYIIPPSTSYEGSEKQLEGMIEQQPEVLGYGHKLLGRQVQAADGRIDLLMEGPDGAKVVVELKKGEADDITVGQILRYLSWVELNRPSNTPPRGIIVAKEFSNNLRLAVRGSSYHIQLIPTSMITENYKRGAH